MPVMTRCYTLWNTSGTYNTYMIGFIDRPLEVGEKLYYWIYCDEENVNTDINVIVTVSDILSDTQTSAHTGYFTALKSGSTWISFSSKWNPDIVLSFRINVVEKTNDSDGSDIENDSQNTISNEKKQKIKDFIWNILDDIEKNSSFLVKTAVNFFRKILNAY